MTTHQDLNRQAAGVAKTLTKGGVDTTSYTASDDTSVKGWMACPLPALRTERRRILILSEQGSLHLLVETPQLVTITDIPFKEAAEVTGQSLVALYTRIDALLTEAQLD